MGQAVINSKTAYICVYLGTKWLDPYTRTALEHLGVEDLQDGEPFQAYGIVDDPENLMQHISGCKLVKSVERRDPPTGM